eukprot:221433-Rhodomonas_salina.1
MNECWRRHSALQASRCGLGSKNHVSSESLVVAASPEGNAGQSQRERKLVFQAPSPGKCSFWVLEFIIASDFHLSQEAEQEEAPALERSVTSKLALESG